jgi:UDP-glucose 4-epimerase
MKCLVTGAAGFVGSNLSGRLLADGHHVIGVDSFTNYYDVSLKRRNMEKVLGKSGFTLIEADLNTMALDQLVDEVEVVFHQAGQPGVRMSWGQEFDEYIYANIRVTQRLLEAFKASTVLRRFIYASSSSVYGDAERYPTMEEDNPKPVSPYGVTKLAAEHLCTLYARNFGIPTVSLRYFTVYGPGQRPDMAFTKFIRAAVRGESITIYGDGSQIRDFTYIGDVVEANIAAATGNPAPGRVYNVAGGTSTSMKEVLGTLGEIAGEFHVEYVDRMAGDVMRTGGSTARIQEELGWRAEVALRDGLVNQLEWVRNERGE